MITKYVLLQIMDHLSSRAAVESLEPTRLTGKLNANGKPEREINPPGDVRDARLFKYYRPVGDVTSGDDALTYSQLKWQNKSDNNECAQFNNASINDPKQELRQEMTICRKKNAICAAGNTRECYYRINPTPIAYDAKKDKNPCGMVNRSCELGMDDFAAGEFKKSKNKDLHEASAKEVCEFLEEKKKGVLEGIGGLIGKANPASWFGASNDEKKKNLLDVGVSQDTVAQTDSSQSCQNHLQVIQRIKTDNTCSQKAFNEVHADVSEGKRQCQALPFRTGLECRELWPLPDDQAKDSIYRMIKQDVDENNEMVVFQNCNAGKEITTTQKSKASLTNSLLQKLNQEATSLMANNKSDVQNCTVLDQKMTACQYLQDRQCCENKVNVDQEIVVNCGFALTERNVKKKNTFAASQLCSLQSTATMDMKQLGELVNMIQQENEQSADNGMAALLWAFIAPLIALIVGGVIVLVVFIGLGKGLVGAGVGAGLKIPQAGIAGISGAVSKPYLFLKYLLYYVPFIVGVVVAVIWFTNDSRKSIVKHASTEGVDLVKNQTFLGKRMPASGVPENCIINKTTLHNLQELLSKEDSGFSAFDLFMSEGVTAENFDPKTSLGTGVLYSGDITVNEMESTTIPFVEGFIGTLKEDLKIKIVKNTDATMEKKKNNKASSFYQSSSLTWSQSLPSTQNERNRSNINGIKFGVDVCIVAFVVATFIVPSLYLLGKYIQNKRSQHLDMIQSVEPWEQPVIPEVAPGEQEEKAAAANAAHATYEAAKTAAPVEQVFPVVQAEVAGVVQVGPGQQEAKAAAVNAAHATYEAAKAAASGTDWEKYEQNRGALMDLKSVVEQNGSSDELKVVKSQLAELNSKFEDYKTRIGANYK